MGTPPVPTDPSFTRGREIHWYDDFFALPKQPPFEAGHGPFRVKGAALADEVALYRDLLKARPRAGASEDPLEPALRLLPSARFAQYLAGPYSRTSWYDLTPLVYLTASVAQVRGIPLSGQLKENAAWHAEQASRGVSGLLLRMVSVQMLASWLPRAAAFFHDFGEVVTQRTGTNHVVALRTGIPHFFVQSWAVIGNAFLESMLARVGAKNVRVYPLPVTESDVRFEYPVYTVPFDVRWDD
jgi:hypothetical protein